MSSMIESPMAETGPAGGAVDVELEVVGRDGDDEEVRSGAGDEVAGADPVLRRTGAVADAVEAVDAVAAVVAALGGPERSARASPSSPNSTSTNPAAITRSSRLTLFTPPVCPCRRPVARLGRRPMLRQLAADGDRTRAPRSGAACRVPASAPATGQLAGCPEQEGTRRVAQS